MVIHLGKSQVFKGHVREAIERRVDFYRSGSHLFEKGAQVISVHTLRGPKVCRG
jgi:hypothetical protein